MLEQLAVEDLSSADCASSSGFDAPGPGAPVIAGVESSVAWDTHLRQVVADLGPVGYVETELVERIAMLLWRLARVVPIEQAAISYGRGTAKEAVLSRRVAAQAALAAQGRPPWPHPEHPDEVQSIAQHTWALDELLRLLPSLPDAAPLATDVAAGAVRAIAKVAAVDLALLRSGALPAGAQLEAWRNWTVQDLRRALDAIAECAQLQPSVLLGRAQEDSELHAHAAAYEAYRVARDLKHLQTARLLPDAEVLTRLVRYESHLGQELERATRLLIDLQAHRQGRGDWQRRA